MPELRPGMFTRIFTETYARVEERTRKSLTLVVLAAERQAKINASNGAHQLRTPTPASRGTGPAVISGTLRRTITHTPVEPDGALGFKARVGMAGGVYAPYNHRTPSSKYAYYLETVWDYPFLRPACLFAMRTAGPAIWAREFRTGSWRAI